MRRRCAYVCGAKSRVMSVRSVQLGLEFVAADGRSGTLPE
nr:hypothetical protein JVH1_4710 [Rhodococcus sp. JVH1]